MNYGGISKWGKDPYSDSQLGGKPGDLPTAKRMKQSADGRAEETTLNAAILSGAGAQYFQTHGVCALLYIPACHTAQWNKQSDKSSGGRMRRRPPLASNEAQNRCGPTATAPCKPCHHAHGQQRQYAPAYPQQRSTQMSRSRERHTQTTADREIGGNAHGTLRHQRKSNAGKSPRRRTARSPRDLPLPRWWNGRGSIPPARANQSRIVRSCHACASSWQRDKAAGLSSY